MFEKHPFAAEIIVTCVLVFALRPSLRDVEKLMAERGMSVDPTTICRWAQERRVIEGLGVDEASLAPWRDGNERLPIGPSTPLGSFVTISFSILTVEAASAGADCGGVGGTMWSKLPSASS